MTATLGRSQQVPRRGRLAALALTALLMAPAAPFAAPAAAAPAPQPLALINATQFEGTQYLIVTALPFAPAMQSIADWKTQKGLPAKVALIGDVKQSYTGRDDAEKLHNFLQDVYFNATNGTLKYVVLGGGVGIIPGRLIQTNGTTFLDYANNYTLSDIYYAGLDSDWDTNGNGTYGEPGEEDWDANVMVGRLPFNDTTQASTMRDNLLSYERSPLVGAWMRDAVAFASVMKPPNNINAPGDVTEYAWGSDNAVRSIWNTEPYLPDHMNLNVLADYYQLAGGNYTPAQDRLSGASMVGAISGGASVVMSVTHGWVPSGRGIPEYTGADGISWSWGTGLTYQNATDLTNIGQLSAGYFSSCLVGNFSDPSLPNLARFLVQPNKGFVVMVLPTDGTLRGEDDFDPNGTREGNWWQSETFWRHFFQGQDPYRFGPALYQEIRDYVDLVHQGIPFVRTSNESWAGYRMQKVVYNLLGDPEVPIWTDIATSFGAALPNESYTAQHHFRATYRDSLGRPVAGATVALMGPGVYTVAKTDAQGRVDVVISPDSTGTLTVTVTAHNFIPRVDTIPVVPAPPDLSLEREDVQLSAASVPLGSTMNVRFTIRNLGQQSSPPTNATAEDIAPGAFPELIGGPIAVPGLSPGSSASLEVNWTPTSEGVHTLRLTADAGGAVVEFDELNNRVSILVPVSSVDMGIQASALSYDPPAEVVPGGLLRVTGPINVSGVVPRGYLIGFTLTSESGAVVRAGNVPASTQQRSFALQMQVPEAGNFSLAITLDLEDVVLEFDETNNRVVRAVRSGAGPTLYTLPPLEVVEGAGPTVLLSDLRAFVADPDTPFEALVFHASSADPRLVVWVEGAALYGVAQPGFSGSSMVTLTVSDGRLEATGGTDVTVVAVNDPPVVAPLPVFEARIGEEFTYQIQASDPEGDALTYSTATPAAQVDRATGLIRITPDQALVGMSTLSFAVSDGTHSVQRTTTLVVRPLNQPPEIADLGPVKVVRGQPLDYRVVARDADGDPVVFSGSAGSLSVTGEGRIVLSGEATRELSPGTYFVRVTASDGFDSTERTVALVVEDAPASAGPPGAAWSTSAAALAAALVALSAAGVGVGLTLGRRRRPAP